MIEGKYITLKEIADILGLKVGTVRQRMRTVEIKPTVLVSGGYRGGVGLYTLEDLEKIRVVKPKGWQKKPKAETPTI
jgi:hypothetical protein